MMQFLFQQGNSLMPMLKSLHNLLVLHHHRKPRGFDLAMKVIEL